MLATVLSWRRLSTMANWSKSFRKSFCEKYRCPSERYVLLATRKSLPWRVRLLRPFILLLHPEHFQMDFEFVERVGNALSWSELNGAFGAFDSNNRLRGGFYRNTLKLRVSGKRLSRLVRRVVERNGSYGPLGTGPASCGIVSR